MKLYQPDQDVRYELLLNRKKDGCLSPPEEDELNVLEAEFIEHSLSLQEKLQIENLIER